MANFRMATQPLLTRCSFFVNAPGVAARAGLVGEGREVFRALGGGGTFTEGKTKEIKG
jgi:hypothetical protein